MDDFLTLNNEFDGDNGSESSDMNLSIFEILEDDLTIDITDDLTVDMSDDLSVDMSDEMTDNISENKINDIINTITNQIQNMNIKPFECGTKGHFLKDYYSSHDIKNEAIIDE
jgi:hypothetical protein